MTCPASRMAPPLTRRHWSGRPRCCRPRAAGAARPSVRCQCRPSGDVQITAVPSAGFCPAARKPLPVAVRTESWSPASDGTMLADEASVHDWPVALVQVASGPTASQPCGPRATSWAACPGDGAPPPGATTAATSQVLPLSWDTKNWARGMSPPGLRADGDHRAAEAGHPAQRLGDSLSRPDRVPAEDSARQAGGRIAAGGQPGRAQHGVTGAGGHDGEHGDRGQQHSPSRLAGAGPPARAWLGAGRWLPRCPACLSFPGGRGQGPGGAPELLPGGTVGPPSRAGAGTSRVTAAAGHSAPAACYARWARCQTDQIVPGPGHEWPEPGPVPRGRRRIPPLGPPAQTCVLGVVRRAHPRP